MTTKMTTKFCGEEYTVARSGNGMWTGTNGQQFSIAEAALESELRASVIASGDDPEEYEGMIAEAVSSAK